jgi:hypothetical protein
MLFAQLGTGSGDVRLVNRRKARAARIHSSANSLLKAVCAIASSQETERRDHLFEPTAYGFAFRLGCGWQVHKVNDNLRGISRHDRSGAKV